jgi:hypothetical protein
LLLDVRDSVDTILSGLILCILQIDAPRRPVQPLRNVHQLPAGFFDNSLGHPAVCHYYLIQLCLTSVSQSSGRHRLSLSARQHEAVRDLASRGHTIFSSLFRRTVHNSHEATPGHPPNQLRGVSSGTLLRRTHEGVRLQERRLTVVDAPFTQGQRVSFTFFASWTFDFTCVTQRYASAGEIRFKKEKDKNTKKASAGSSRPPRSSVTQQSGAAPQTQPSPQSNATISTSSTTLAVTATSAAVMSTISLPDVTIRKAGHWTRFWLRFCCAPAEYTHGHH